MGFLSVGGRRIMMTRFHLNSVFSIRFFFSLLILPLMLPLIIANVNDKHKTFIKDVISQGIGTSYTCVCTLVIL